MDIPPSLYIIQSFLFIGIITTDYNQDFITRVVIVKKALHSFNEYNMENILKESTNFITSINKRIKNENSVFSLSEDINLLVTNTMWRLLFDKRLELKDTDYKSLSRMLDLLTSGLAVSNLIDGFPLLRNIPIGKYLYIDDFNAIRDKLISAHVEEQSKNFHYNDKKCFTDILLSEHAQLSRDNVEIILTDILCAGIETVYATFRFVILYLLLNKDITKKCYDEVEIVIGENELNFKDICNFHYIRAVISEVLRISPAAPFGVPHKTTTDTSIFEYGIPQNTTLLLNIYAIHHDSTVHLNPEKFTPQRFIDNNGHYQNIHGFIPFSIGRRECLGKKLGMQQLLFYIVTLLQNFYLQAPEGFDVTDASISRVCIKPREHNVKIIRRKLLNSTCNLSF